MKPLPDLFSYTPPKPPTTEEPSAELFPDVDPPGLQSCTGDCVWIEFGLATAETGCEMCRARDDARGSYTPFSETIAAVFGDRQPS